MTDKKELTPAQRAEVKALHTRLGAIRGVQIAVIAGGAALAIFDGRGWPAFVIGLGMAVYIECCALPVLPAWLEKLRPDDK